MPSKMVSIQGAIRHVEQLEAAAKAVSDAYRAMIADSRRYVVEIDPESAARHLRALAEILRGLGSETLSATECETAGQAFAGALSRYKGESEQALAALRGQLEDTAAALQSMVEKLTAGEGEEERKVRDNLVRLKRLADAEDLERLRADLRALAVSLEAAIDGMDRQKQLLVAQFKTEIRALHKEVQLLAHMATNGAHPPDARAAISKRLASGKPCAVLLVSIGNYRALRTRESDADAVVRACLARFAAVLPSGDAVGMWREGVLAAALSAPGQSVLDLSKSVAGHLGGVYVTTAGGERREYTLQVSTTVVQGKESEKEASFLGRVDRAAAALVGG